MLAVRETVAPACRFRQPGRGDLVPTAENRAGGNGLPLLHTSVSVRPTRNRFTVVPFVAPTPATTPTSASMDHRSRTSTAGDGAASGGLSAAGRSAQCHGCTARVESLPECWFMNPPKEGGRGFGEAAFTCGTPGRGPAGRGHQSGPSALPPLPPLPLRGQV